MLVLRVVNELPQRCAECAQPERHPRIRNDSTCKTAEDAEDYDVHDDGVFSDMLLKRAYPSVIWAGGVGRYSPPRGELGSPGGCVAAGAAEASVPAPPSPLVPPSPVFPPSPFGGFFASSLAAPPGCSRCHARALRSGSDPRALAAEASQKTEIDSRIFAASIRSYAVALVVRVSPGVAFARRRRVQSTPASGLEYDDADESSEELGEVLSVAREDVAFALDRGGCDERIDRVVSARAPEESAGEARRGLGRW